MRGLFIVSLALCSLMLMYSSVYAREKPPSGGISGMIALVCRGENGSISRSELLDLYEAQEQYHQKLWPSQGKFEEDYVYAEKNFRRLQGGSDWDPSDAASVHEKIKKFYETSQYTGPKEHLPWIGDSTLKVQPPTGCQFEQLALMKEGGEKILIDQEIWNSLSSQNRAALLTHQLSYHDALSFEDQPSQSTRVAVGLVYSSGGVSVFDGLPSKKWSCFANSFVTGQFTTFFSYHFYSDDGRKLGTLLQFQQLGERALVAKTVARFVDIDWNLSIEDPNTHFAIQYPPVQETGANKKVRVAFEGDQIQNTELEVDYVYGQPVRMTLIKSGIPVDTEVVEFCQAE